MPVPLAPPNSLRKGRRGWETDCKSLQKELYLQNPEIKWQPNPKLHTFQPQRPSSYIMWGMGESGKKARTIAPPTLVGLTGPCPTPIPGEGAKLGREPLAQASSEGVWWSLEAGREGRSCFPFGPRPPPLPPPRVPGAQQTGWRWGQGGLGQSAGTGPGSAVPAGGGSFAPRLTP